MSRRLIVFAGPPCSGKSTLAQLLSQKTGIEHLSMDGFRARLLPNSDHRKEHRNLAYQALHAAAEQSLRRGCDVIVDATYAPGEHRVALSAVCSRTGSAMFLIECRTSPEVARARFRGRRHDHPAVDLNETRVRELACGYPFNGLGKLIDTSGSLSGCLGDVESYLQKDEPLIRGREPEGPVRWLIGMPPENAGEPEEPRGPKLTERSRFVAKRQRWTATTLYTLSIASGVVSLAFFTLGFFEGSLEERGNIWVAATFLGVAAVMAGQMMPLYAYWQKVRARTRPLARAGDIARYGPTKDVRRPDYELYGKYYCRTRIAQRNRYCVAGVPVFFVIPPRNGTSFDVLLEGGGQQLDPNPLSQAASAVGFDWNGFARYRIDEKKSQYRSWLDQSGLRCTSIVGDDWRYVLQGTKCKFSEYLCRELATNVVGPAGLIPDMRRLLEGLGWQDFDLDLLDIKDAAHRYSMLVSTSVLVSTADGYLVLHRRSDYVYGGSGGISATSGGFVNWNKDFRLRLGRVSLQHAAQRELWEEMGLKRKCLHTEDRPFLAAGFNLLRGRDLSFYAHYRSKCCSFEVRELLSKAPTRWEVASLLFLPLSSIRFRAPDILVFDPPFDHMASYFNRHLRAALCAFAVGGALERTIQLTPRIAK